MSAAEVITKEEDSKTKVKQEKVHTWPNLVAKEFLCGLLFLVIIFFYSYYVDAPLRELANPGEPGKGSLVLPRTSGGLRLF